MKFRGHSPRGLDHVKEMMDKDQRFPTEHYLNPKKLINKTIKSIDTSTAANIIRIFFEDGTDIVIDTAPLGLGLYTPVIVDSKYYKFKK